MSLLTRTNVGRNILSSILQRCFVDCFKRNHAATAIIDYVEMLVFSTHVVWFILSSARFQSNGRGKMCSAGSCFTISWVSSQWMPPYTHTSPPPPSPDTHKHTDENFDPVNVACCPHERRQLRFRSLFTWSAHAWRVEFWESVSAARDVHLSTRRAGKKKSFCLFERIS